MNTRLKIYFRNAPVPSRMLALIKLLVKNGPLSRQDTFTFLHPSLIKNHTDDLMQSIEIIPESEQFKDVIDAAKECGLIEIKGHDKIVSISPKIEKELSDLKNIDETFPVVMAELTLAHRINNEENLFAKVCAWILNQPVLGCPQDHDGWKKLMLEQAGDLLDASALRNDAAWDMVAYWMRYLGIAGRTNYEGIKGLVPDPTLYLSRIIDRLLTPGEELSASEFRSRLGSLCPVLDGGTVFLEMKPQDRAKDLLSDGLSLALERLRHRNMIKYRCLDDQRDFFRMTNQEKLGQISFVSGN